MIRTRVYGNDNMFSWARTEMKREMVMSQSSYAKIAGLQSEVGRVVITRVAGSELEYKRTLNMYRKDVTCSVNNIKREQIKMRIKLARYIRKMKQTRIEHAKLIKEQQRRDQERALLEELHLRLKQEAAASTPEPEVKETDTHLDDEIENDEIDPDGDFTPIAPPFIDFKKDSMFLQTGLSLDKDEEQQGNNRIRKQSMVFEPKLPMINEDAEKECDAVDDNENVRQEQPEPDRFDLKVWDEEMSVSSYGGRIRKKKDVSFSDIMKLKYSGTKKMFALVHRLAKKHGIPDVEEKVPDPRDNVVHRGSTNDSFRLQASVLYPMKYGYDPDQDGDNLESARMFAGSRSPAVIESDQETSISDHREHDNMSSAKYSHRSLLKTSRSVDEGSNSNSYDVTDLPRRRISRDLSMTELVGKMGRIKTERVDRLSSSQRLESEMISSYNLLSPHKPSSSRSVRSLPAISKNSGKESNDKVTWTQAFGLLRAIHSLEDVSG
ncbi:hypothetical protein ACF0H5_013610 [Mactra antiquata]